MRKRRPALTLGTVKHSGKILLQSAPPGVYVEEIKQDIEQVWSLQTSVAFDGLTRHHNSSQGFSAYTSYTYGLSINRKPSLRRTSSWRMTR